MLIAFIGYVFSPRYFNARRHGPADPYEFPAFNVAVYGSTRKHWAMTEYSRRALRCGPDAMTVGRNRLAWDGQRLVCTIDERGAPIPTPIRGTISLTPELLTDFAVQLDSNRQHWWQPLAPRARVDVELTYPKLRWSGAGYLDTNYGDSPLESGIEHWSWMRAESSAGTRIVYDVQPTHGDPIVHHLEFDTRGQVRNLRPPPVLSLPPTLWGIPRHVRIDPLVGHNLIGTLESAPFYSRTALELALDGRPGNVMQESLSMRRFRSPWVRALLPFRMRRCAH